MQQLNRDSLTQIHNHPTPAYRQMGSDLQIGMVHLGPGAFFRGHQAWYTHKAIEAFGGDWGISCVSMRSPGVSEALTPQDGLYTLAVLDKETSYEVVGSVKEVLIAKSEYQAVQRRLQLPSTKLVSMTITEKGYYLDSEGNLDLAHSDIKQDLTRKDPAITAVGLLVEALEQRKLNGIDAFTTLSCDNVTDNGKKLKRALVQYAAQLDTALSEWLQQSLISPCTMVDSITPATDDSLREQVAEQINLKDNWPIKRESFVQWVIEDNLTQIEAPNWQAVGATLTSDVQGFENAKLRLLNCPHSTMAYLGVLAGTETVYDAMQDDALVSFVEQLIQQEIIPSFSAPKELDVQQYKNDILNRFRNPAIRHLLNQIAWDGSQKLPMRVLPIIEDNLENNKSIALLCHSIAAWFLFCRKRFIDNEELVDPLAEDIFEIAKQCTDEPLHDISKFLSLNTMFSDKIANNKQFTKELSVAYNNLLPSLTSRTIPWQQISQ